MDFDWSLAFLMAALALCVLTIAAFAADMETWQGRLAAAGVACAMVSAALSIIKISDG